MTKFLKKNLLRSQLRNRFIKKNINKTIKPNKTKENKEDLIMEENEIEISDDGNEKNIIIPKEKKNKKTTEKININQKSKKESSKFESIEPQLSIDAIKEHYYTFNLVPELYTILYSTLIFKWIQTDKILILVDQNNIGYRLEIFLKSFKINCCLLDNEMPVNTNNHFANSFIKGNFKICISNKSFSQPSPNFVDKIIENSPIPISLIYFDFLDSNLLNDHCFRINVKTIHHLLSFDNRKNFSTVYNSLDTRITFQEFEYNKDQVAHLRYRCEDIYHTIKKSDIKKAKTKKINQELLHSKDMEKYFETHPEERLNIINAIKDNNYYTVKASATYLPSYLIHEDSKENKIEQAIVKNYGNENTNNKLKNSNLRRKRKGKMQEYLECLERNDGSEKLIKF